MRGTCHFLTPQFAWNEWKEIGQKPSDEAPNLMLGLRLSSWQEGSKVLKRRINIQSGWTQEIETQCVVAGVAQNNLPLFPEAKFLNAN